MSYFINKDLELIDSLKYNPNLKPRYEILRDYLVWDDEIPIGMTEDGYDRLCLLLVARSYIHRNISFACYTFNPKILEEIWNSVLNMNTKWPGFRRLKLSERDLSCYFSQ